MSQEQWNKLHEFYQKHWWIKEHNYFAEEIVRYLPETGSMLCLGDGQGADSRFFADQGYRIVSTDISDVGLETNRVESADRDPKQYTVEILDLSEPFPHSDETFDAVYAHLSIHYFTHAVTEQIFNEVWRVLKPNGIFAALSNSTTDPEYGTGTKIESDVFFINEMQKRYFSVESMRGFGKKFDIVLCDDQGHTRKDDEKGVQHLIRFVGKKTSQ